MQGRAGIWIVLGAVSGFFAVGLGAFGAHGLERVATEGQLAWWRTATLYHLLHAPVLMLVGVVSLGRPGPRVVGTAFLVGTVIFSGTLYALALGAPRWLGAVTPVGGLALMAGWLGFALGAWRSRS